jgi:hypothetical protein
VEKCANPGTNKVFNPFLYTKYNPLKNSSQKLPKLTITHFIFLIGKQLHILFTGRSILKSICELGWSSREEFFAFIINTKKTLLITFKLLKRG